MENHGLCHGKNHNFSTIKPYKKPYPKRYWKNIGRLWFVMVDKTITFPYPEPYPAATSEMLAGAM